MGECDHITMFIEVDIEQGYNCDYSLARVFSTVDVSMPITSVETTGMKGELDMFDVIGWSGEGPCPAYAVVVEDSGEGHALLIYGGDDGIRFRPKDSEEPWGLEAQDQWGEPCLLLDTSAQIEVEPGK